MMKNKKVKKEKQKIKCYEFYVEGMHCAACELTVERDLKKFKGVKTVDAKLDDGIVKIEIDSTKSIENIEELAKDLTKLVKKDGYEILTENPGNLIKRDWKDYVYAIPIAIILILLFWILQSTGLVSAEFGVSFTAVFIAGIAASLSTCAAVVGGLVLSISANYAKENSKTANLRSQIFFHSGRLIGFFLLGGFLGLIGGIFPTQWIVSTIIGGIFAYYADFCLTKKFFKTNLGSAFVIFFTLIIGAIAVEFILQNIAILSQIEIKYIARVALTLLVAFVMIILGLNLLELFNFTKKLQFKLPKAFSHTILKTEKINKWFGPILLGASTFFLPCGFTYTVQGEALKTGNALTSALMMFAFALGTLPVLAIISFASVNLGERIRTSKVFFKVSGILVLAFAVYDLIGALHLMGWFL